MFSQTGVEAWFLANGGTLNTLGRRAGILHGIIQPVATAELLAAVVAFQLCAKATQQVIIWSDCIVCDQQVWQGMTVEASVPRGLLGGLLERSRCHRPTVLGKHSLEKPRQGGRDRGCGWTHFTLEAMAVRLQTSWRRGAHCVAQSHLNWWQASVNCFPRHAPPNTADWGQPVACAEQAEDCPCRGRAPFSKCRLGKGRHTFKDRSKDITSCQIKNHFAAQVNTWIIVLKTNLDCSPAQAVKILRTSRWKQRAVMRTDPIRASLVCRNVKHGNRSC